jgi:hypothetical protein
MIAPYPAFAEFTSLFLGLGLRPSTRTLQG